MPVYYCKKINLTFPTHAPKHDADQKTNCDWWHCVAVKRPLGRSLAEESSLATWD